MSSKKIYKVYLLTISHTWEIEATSKKDAIAQGLLKTRSVMPRMTNETDPIKFIAEKK
jgi:hypothetical protein